MGNTITILLGDTTQTEQRQVPGLAAPGTVRDKLDLDPQQFVDKLAPVIEALEKATSLVKGSLHIAEAEFCIGVDVNGNIGIRPLGGVEAGLKTALKVVIKRG